MTEESITISDYAVLIDNEQEKTYLQFAVGDAKLRRPTCLVVDVPGEPVTLEDERGVIAEFTKRPSEDDFLAFALSGTIHLMPVKAETTEVEEVIPVRVRSRLHLVTPGARH